MADLKKKRGNIIIIIPKTFLAEKQDASKYGVFRVSLLVPKYYKQIYQTKYYILFQFKNLEINIKICCFFLYKKRTNFFYIK